MRVNRIITGIFLIFLISGFKNSDDLLKVKINTESKSENVSAKYTVEKWNKKSKLISISITNNGDKIEFIKDVHIQLNNTPQFNEKSKFIYGGYDMGRTPIQARGYNQEQERTESVLLSKVDDKNYFKVGVLSWNIFRASISFSKDKGITIVADGENKPIKPGETIQFEKLVLENGNNWQDMLYAYGEQIAKIQNIKPKTMIQFKGWSTWDYYGQKFTDKEIKMNIEELKKLSKDGNIIQIDGGWWIDRGDYLISREDIPGGMKAIGKMISDNGYTPGIHLDGFRAEMSATVYKQHPDWFLKDQNGATIFEEYQKNGKAVQRIYFDYSNPAARDYIKNVLKTIREDWGFNYFKIDFMRYGLNDDIFKMQKNTDLKEIHAFDESMTSMERTRAGLKAMREGIADAFFLGCSSVFGPTLGIVDGLRSGGDIDPTFEAYTGRCIQNGGNFYLNQTVVQNDADYLVLRNKDDEEAERAWDIGRKFGGNVTLDEATMWTNYVTLFGGIKISSDNLNTLRPERKELVVKAFSLNTCNRFIPIDLWDKAKDKQDAFNIMLGTNKQGVFIALFNWDSADLEINLSNISTDQIKLVNSDNAPAFTADKKALNIKLKGHTSVIFQLNDKADFDKVRNQIKYQLTKS
jgi:alpha-galactosidase